MSSKQTTMSDWSELQLIQLCKSYNVQQHLNSFVPKSRRWNGCIWIIKWIKCLHSKLRQHHIIRSFMTSAWRNKAVCLRVFLYTNVTEAEEHVWQRTWYVLSVCSAPSAPPTPVTSSSTSRGPGIASELSGRSLSLPNRLFGGYKQSCYVRRMFACREVVCVCVFVCACACVWWGSAASLQILQSIWRWR